MRMKMTTGRLVGGMTLAICPGRFGDGTAAAAASMTECTIAAC
jgi:hypothetical protein